MINGINHLTLAVTDIQKSMFFYHKVLGMKLHASWTRGAYLTCDSLWVCLSLDHTRRVTRSEDTDYTHYAFSVTEDSFPIMVEKLKQSGVQTWKDNLSEGYSFYFLDPDGHKLEIHVGSLIERLKSCETTPYDRMVFYS
ncbi:fosfomycin resistance glutathione transferase [Providencia burhodogranariea]|uniref:Bleomycin resistance protein n=1 Tax=Providencia burhodogranariea DSM 19968 TaxID=1141662 RepID=K8X1S7_9GAMM|nr:fosfomycin resistance glutathione transferase [Providencia burhodogranariea]EKT62405.1 bleomycin resistance protein [Providencia burhodogranariea DSM 19968]